MYNASDEVWEDLTRERAWNEAEAVRPLQKAG
jgi:hypothetical protein